MRRLLKSSFRVFVMYTIVLSIFTFSLLPIVGISKQESLVFALSVFSIVMFLLLTYLLYTEVWQIAHKEVKLKQETHPYPYKGFIIGFLGFLPWIILTLALLIFKLPDAFANNLQRKMMHLFLGPEYFIVKLGGKSVIAYAMALISVPVISGFSYMAGYYNFSFTQSSKKNKKATLESTTPRFSQSPWNPTVPSVKKRKK